MKKVNLNVEVKYSVQIEVEVDEDVYDDLMEANGEYIGDNDYKLDEVKDYLIDNIVERDAYTHEYYLEVTDCKDS